MYQTEEQVLHRVRREHTYLPEETRAKLRGNTWYIVVPNPDPEGEDIEVMTMDSIGRLYVSEGLKLFKPKDSDEVTGETTRWTM